MKTTRKRRIAEELCVLFYDAVRSEASKFLSRGVERGLRSRTLDEVNASDRRAFLAAARACIDLDAEPREYVTAQFAAYREASAYHRKLIWTSPQQMGTDQARMRYLQFKAREVERKARITQLDDQDERKRFYVEERKLRGLARMQRLDPVDVLAEQPEQFSRAFLEHKHVWEVVKDLWHSRRES